MTHFSIGTSHLSPSLTSFSDMHSYTCTHFRNAISYGIVKLTSLFCFVGLIFSATVAAMQSLFTLHSLTSLISLTHPHRLLPALPLSFSPPTSYPSIYLLAPFTHSVQSLMIRTPLFVSNYISYHFLQTFK